jgi:NADH:ubiquinone oxidoreductase subunit C
MHGICFVAKKDLRNLMLQYGDSTAPLRKLYPSVGHQELVFDPINDTVVQVPVSVQV